MIELGLVLIVVGAVVTMVGGSTRNVLVGFLLTAAGLIIVTRLAGSLSFEFVQFVYS